jgi:hypothetical protein
MEQIEYRNQKFWKRFVTPTVLRTLTYILELAGRVNLYLNFIIGLITVGRGLS